MGWVEAGLKPIKQRLESKMILYMHDLVMKKKDLITVTVAKVVMNNQADHCTYNLQASLTNWE